MLTVGQLSYTYVRGSHWLFRNLSFTATGGERIVIVGANGTGKSTLARLLGGLISLQEGTISLNDSAVFQLNGKARPITLLQRFDELFLATRADREIAINYELAEVPPQDIPARVKTQAEKFGVSNLLTRSCHSLSQGERLRVALAAQFTRTTPLVIVDEADAFLDMPGRQLLRDTLTSLAKTGTIVIRVSHDFGSIESHERVLLLNDCQLQECGAGPDGVQKAKEQLEKIFPEDSSDVTTRPENLATFRAASLDLSNVSFSPGKEIHFGPLSLKLGGVTLTGLLGSNGTGKSILAQLLAGLLPYSTGEYLVTRSNGKPVSSIELLPTPALIGYLPAEPERFFTAATVRESFQDGDSDVLRNWAEILDFNLEVFRNRDPLSLSGGEQRRLAMLMALQHDPGYLILDEPTANLDLIGRRRFTALLTTWSDSGRGALIVSHDIELLQKSCTRILTLDHGSGQ